MSTNLAEVIFLTATVVAVFAFVSIVVWVTTQAEERKARDRFALLKTLAEHPGDNAARVLDLLREQEARQADRKEREERKGFLAGGVVCLAVGIGLSVMLATLDPKAGAWTVGLLVGLVGLALLPFGLSAKPRDAARNRTEKSIG